MKKIRLNPQILSTMFIGFNRHLFTAPKQGDMYSVDEDNHDCTIYFTEDFWEKYVHQPPMRLFLAGILAGGSVVGILWLLMYFLIFKKKINETGANHRKESVSQQASFNKVRDACFSGSVERTKQALLDLGRVLWPDNPPLTLSEWADRFNNKTVSEQIEKLNKVLYAGQAADWDAKEFWNTLKAARSDYKNQKQR